MKFFHIADLHFGRMLHNLSLETDQAFWVDRFLQAVDLYEPDAVVIAGDIYDRRVPPGEAMLLFDHLLTELSRREKAVLVIPGNHDSAVRVSHVHELLASSRVYIAGRLSEELAHVTVSGVTFWLMPYMFPKAVADLGLTEPQGPLSYDEAARLLLSAQKIDTDACNVLVAHQNVLANGIKPEHSDSETIIGGIGEIDYTAFDAFDYVALGHIHNAQKIGRETVRYAGCPLYYDFSEISRSKDLTLVTVHDKGRVEVERIGIDLPHRLLRVEGDLEMLLAKGAGLQDRESYYIQCILTDRHVPPRAMEQLREVYGDSLVNVKREVLPGKDALRKEACGSSTDSAPLSLEEQFGRFFQDMQEEMIDEKQEALVRKILEQQTRRSGDFIQRVSDIPQEESQEVLDDLMQELLRKH